MLRRCQFYVLGHLDLKTSVIYLRTQFGQNSKCTVEFIHLTFLHYKFNFFLITKKHVDTSLYTMWCCIKFYNTKQYNTIQYNTIQYNTIQYNTIQYIVQYRTICQFFIFEMFCIEVPCNIIVQHVAK